MAIAPSPTNVSSFPLERPSLRVRRRDAPAVRNALPYFIAGPENRMAAHVCQSEAAIFELGNPILLLGASGVGKTAIALHLAARELAARQELASRDDHPDEAERNTLFLTAVDFARQYAEAVASDDLPPFRAPLDEAAVLVIDDLHLIADKPAAQDELAMRLESRTAHSMATLLTCRRLPSEIRGMRSLLVSRVLPGLTISIRPPGEEARIWLLRELALQHDLPLSDDLVEQLARGIDPHAPTRRLEASIKHLTLWCRMNGGSVTSDAVRSALEVVGRTDEVTLTAITQAVARQFRERSADLRSGSRKQHLVRARSLAMFLARRLTTKSMHQIGDHFGGRDHTTVLHAIRKTERLLDEDADLRRAADEVTEKLTLR